MTVSQGRPDSVEMPMLRSDEPILEAELLAAWTGTLKATEKRSVGLDDSLELEWTCPRCLAEADLSSIRSLTDWSV